MLQSADLHHLLSCFPSAFPSGLWCGLLPVSSGSEGDGERAALGPGSAIDKADAVTKLSAFFTLEFGRFHSGVKLWREETLCYK